MKFKKIMLFALTILCFGSIVNAEVTTLGNKTYVSGKKIYCGESEVLLSTVIDKTNKIVVVDANDSTKQYIWNEDNTCSDITTQDYLDLANSTSYYTSISGNIVEMYHKNYDYVEGYILNTSVYNENETYYEYDIEYEEMIEVDVNEETPNLNTYFVLRYYKNQETTTVNRNTTYYKLNENYEDASIFVVANINEINENNINEYYIETTLDSAKTESKIYTYNETIYNRLTENAYQANVEVWDEKMYLIIYEYNLDTFELLGTTYYDEQGNEITEYKNTYVSFTDNYKLVYSYTDKKLRVYEKDTNAFITTISFEEGNTPFSLTNIEYNKNLYFLEIGDTYITNYVRRYEILDGDNQTYNNEDLTIRFNGNYKLFNGLLINGKELDSKNYTSKEGSTIVTLNSSYLNTLEDGTYTLTATYSDGGKINTSININNNPKTSDTTLVNMILCLLSTSLLLVFLNKKLVK